MTAAANDDGRGLWETPLALRPFFIDHGAAAQSDKRQSKPWLVVGLEDSRCGNGRGAIPGPRLPLFTLGNFAMLA